MKRILLTTALLVTTAIASNVSADYLDVLRHEYDLSRSELRNEYKSRLEASDYAYRRDRDALLAKRRAILRIDHHKTRSLRLRTVNHKLSDIAREKGIRARELSKWFSSANRELRHGYDTARTTARRTPVVVETRVHAHPDNCVCDVCRPPVPVSGVRTNVRANAYDTGYGGGYDAGYDDYGRAPVRDIHHEAAHRYERRSPNGLDIASIILSLLNN